MVRAVALLIVLATLGVGAPAGGAQDARAAVAAFVARLQDVSISDFVVRQTFTLYHPEGRHPQSTGEQRVLVKLPQRQRVEQTVEGRREVRLAVGERVWIRQADGKTYETPRGEPGGDRTHLLVPFRRSAADLLAEWRALGVREDVSHVTRLGGRVVTVIGARPGDRDVPSVWLDTEYGVVRFIRREQLPSGSGLVNLAFSEHRPLIGGFYFPHRQEFFLNGKLFMLVMVSSVRVNVNLADALFDPEALRKAP